MPKTKKKKKVREEEEIEVQDSDEELEDDEEGEGSSRSDSVTFGVADLCALIEERTGKTYTTREMRTLLRKMARSGKLNREIKAGNKARYDWSGPTDPEIKRVIKAVEAGEIEKGKKEALENLKKSVAEKRAKDGGKKGKKKKAPVAEDEEEEFEEVDVDEDETDEDED